MTHGGLEEPCSKNGYGFDPSVTSFLPPPSFPLNMQTLHPPALRQHVSQQPIHVNPQQHKKETPTEANPFLNKVRCILCHVSYYFILV